MKIRRLVAGIVATTAIAAVAFAFIPEKEEVVDARFSGAYRLADGSLATIMPSTPTRLRMRHLVSCLINILNF